MILIFSGVFVLTPPRFAIAHKGNSTPHIARVFAIEVANRRDYFTARLALLVHNASSRSVKPKRIFLAEGSYFAAYREGDWVYKKTKSVLGDVGDVTYSLGDDERRELAKYNVVYHNRLREELIEDPKVRAHFPNIENIFPLFDFVEETGEIKVPYVEGLKFTDLSPSVQALAEQKAEQLIEAAQNHMGRKLTPVRGTRKWKYRIDSETRKLVFDTSGNVVGWFDPIEIIPTKRPFEYADMMP